MHRSSKRPSWGLPLVLLAEVGWGITASVGFELALDLRVETVCSWGVQWVSKAIQFEGLANGRDRILD